VNILIKTIYYNNMLFLQVKCFYKN